MNIRRLSTFLTLVLFSILLSSNTFAQDYTQWELPKGAIARLGKGGINEIQYSPDGMLLAVASDIGIWLYDTSTSQEITLLTGHTAPVLSLAFSSNGRTFVSGGGDGTIRFWDRNTGTHKTRLIAYQLDVNSLAFSPDGHLLASGSDDGAIRLWDAITAEHRVTMTLGRHAAKMNSVVFSPDGNTIAGGSEDGNVYLWDTHTNELKRTLIWHADGVKYRCVQSRWWHTRDWIYAWCHPSLGYLHLHAQENVLWTYRLGL